MAMSETLKFLCTDKLIEVVTATLVAVVVVVAVTMVVVVVMMMVVVAVATMGRGCVIVNEHCLTVILLIFAEFAFLLTCLLFCVSACLFAYSVCGC